MPSRLLIITFPASLRFAFLANGTDYKKVRNQLVWLAVPLSATPPEMYKNIDLLQR